MVLPLVGLLAAGAAAFAHPHAKNRNQRIQGRYNSEVMDGVNAADPNATRDALFGGGLLTGSEFQGDSRTAYEGQAGRDAAMARTQASAGAAMARQMQAQRHAASVRAEQTKLRTDAMAALGYDISSPLANLPSVQDAVFNATGGELGRQAAEATRVGALTPEQHAAEVLAQEQAAKVESTTATRTILENNEAISEALGPNKWTPQIELTGAQQGDLIGTIQSLDNAQTPIMDAITYFEETTRAGRVMDADGRAELNNRLATVSEAIRRAEEKGVLQEAEAKRLEERIAKLGGREGVNVAKLRGVQTLLNQYTDNAMTRAELSINPATLNAVFGDRRGSGQADVDGSTLVPGPAPGG